MNESATTVDLSVAGASPSPLRVKRVLLLFVVPVVAVLTSAAVYLHGGRYVETDNAYVKADKVPISSEVSGAVADVFVQDNQQVKAGQLLFRLDPAPFRLAGEKAAAKLAQVRTDLSALKASYREKQAEIALARTNQAFAGKELQRFTNLAAKNYIAAYQLDDAKHSADVATQQIATLEQDLKRIAESLGGSVDAPVERHPSYLSAQAELEQAQLDIARADVRAPLDGTVSKPPRNRQYLMTGNTAMALVIGGKPWVEANFTETDLTYVRPGQPVTIHIDTYPDVQWQGVVESMSPATGAEFSVLPAQNATGNWVKIAQRVPVRIQLETGSKSPELRAGLSTRVTIDTGHQRHLPGLAL